MFTKPLFLWFVETATISSLTWALKNFLFVLFEWFIHSPTLGSFFTYMCWIYSAKGLRGTFFRSPVLSVPPRSGFLSDTLPCEHHPPWRPWTPNSIFPTPGFFWALPGLPFTVLESGDSLQENNWGNDRAHLICFSSLRNHHPTLPSANVWKPLFLIPLPVYSLGQEQGRESKGPIAPIWPEAHAPAYLWWYQIK